MHVVESFIVDLFTVNYEKIHRSKGRKFQVLTSVTCK